MPGMRADPTILSEDPGSGNPEAFTDVRYTVRGGTVIWHRFRESGVAARLTCYRPLARS